MAKLNKQTEVRVNIDADFLATLQARLGLSKSTDITKVALTLLDWASDEVGHDRMILSTKKDGKEAHRLVLPELSKVKKVANG